MEPSPSCSAGARPHDFDPSQKVFDSWGFSYRSFAAYLCGEKDAEDKGNHAIDDQKRKGRSAAFCKAFRSGYDRLGHESFVQVAVAERNESDEGWIWAQREGFADKGAAPWRSVSLRNVRIGLGYSAARSLSGNP